MNNRLSPLVVGIWILGCVLAAFGTSHSLPGQETRTGRVVDEQALVVLERHLDSIGGLAVLQRHKSSIRRGVFDSNAGGMTGKITAWQKQNRFLVKLELEDFGAILRGCNGDIVWTIHPNDGPMIVTGKAEFDLRQANAFVDSAAGWSEDRFEGRIFFDGPTELDGQQVDKVVFQPKHGSEATRYFDSQSGRLLKTSTSMDAGSRGQVSFDVSFSGFRETAGLTIAMDQEFEIRDGHSYQIRFSQVELGPEIPDSIFDLPDEIQALIGSTNDD